MSLTNHELASQSLAKDIISKDIELAAKMSGKNLHADEIYQLFRQRLYLFDQVSNIPLARSDRLLLDSKKAEVGMELKLFRFRQHIEEEMKEVISRLEALESQLVTLKEMSMY